MFGYCVSIIKRDGGALMNSAQVYFEDHVDGNACVAWGLFKYSSIYKSSHLIGGRGKKGKPSDQPSKGILLQNWVGTMPNHTVTSMMYKATASDKHKTLALAAMN
ncbi:hypothetical protein TNCV_4681561 [Trichonephila clavipes]|nr:hypothetical protein TNCV_4681561 [Trichonephila clavipes]